MYLILSLIWLFILIPGSFIQLWIATALEEIDLSTFVSHRNSWVFVKYAQLVYNSANIVASFFLFGILKLFGFLFIILKIFGKIQHDFVAWWQRIGNVMFWSCYSPKIPKRSWAIFEISLSLWNFILNWGKCLAP